MPHLKPFNIAHLVSIRCVGWSSEPGALVVCEPLCVVCVWWTVVLVIMLVTLCGLSLQGTSLCAEGAATIGGALHRVPLLTALGYVVPWRVGVRV